MFKRTVASLITVLLLVGSFVFLLQIHHANAAGTIYIRADGTIDPPTAPVQREGDLYTLIGDVVSDTRGIYIEGRSNMELNGAGHTVQGNRVEIGIVVSHSNNVTVKNVIVMNFSTGLGVYGCEYNTITGNSIRNNTEYGVIFGQSFYCDLGNNTIQYNGVGVRLDSMYDIVFNNTCTLNGYAAIEVAGDNNTLRSNDFCFTQGGGAVKITGSNNLVCGNNITSNVEGGIYIWGTSVRSSFNRITGNNISLDGNCNLYVGESNNNTIDQNVIAHAYAFGVYLNNSTDNKFYDNDFLGNEDQAEIVNGAVDNTWDDGYPSGGNYWSDYTGTDANSDGIGDTPYIIDADNIDRYPLMTPYHTVPEEGWSFAVIADLHVGWGYCDYGNMGYDDPNLSEAQNYWLTERLESVVDRIIETKDTGIKFVVVLGDLADSAEKSELLKAREILSRLNDPNGDGDTTDGIPYVPVIGNHDVWPYTQSQGCDPDDRKHIATTVNNDPEGLGDRFFQEIFWEAAESQKNRDLIVQVFGSSWDRQVHSSPPYLMNYKFRFGEMNFVCLDFNPRDPIMAYPGTIWGAMVQPFNDTWIWYYQFLMENSNKDVIVFSHHPMSLEGEGCWLNTHPKYLLDHEAYVEQCKDIIEQYNVNVYDFGGHTHVNYVSNSSIAQYVVETEAVFQESADIIRIVSVNGHQINYNTFEGVNDSDPGLGLFFTFSPGNPSSGQSTHFVARTVEFAGGRLSLRFAKELSVACLNCFYNWSLGDGQIVQGWGNPIPVIGADDPYHSYAFAGAYYVNLTVNTPEGTVGLNRYPIYINDEFSPIYYIWGIPENFEAVSTGRGVSVAEGGDGQNTFETVLMSKTASPGTPIVEFGVHFENAVEDIDFSTFVADVNATERKSFFCFSQEPSELYEPELLFIPSSGRGAVYLCLNVTSLGGVRTQDADLVIAVGKTKNGITAFTSYYEGIEYYVLSGITAIGGGELPGLGDINGDGIVDIYDAILLAGAFNSQPSNPYWKPCADINIDDIVDIYDAIILANHYNQHYP